MKHHDTFPEFEVKVRKQGDLTSAYKLVSEKELKEFAKEQIQLFRTYGFI